MVKKMIDDSAIEITEKAVKVTLSRGVVLGNDPILPMAIRDKINRVVGKVAKEKKIIIACDERQQAIAIFSGTPRQAKDSIETAVNELRDLLNGGVSFLPHGLAQKLAS